MTQLKYIKLRRASLHGISAWGVWVDGVLVGHAVQQTMGWKWAARPIDQDEYDDLEFWHNSRESAVKALTKENPQ